MSNESPTSVRLLTATRLAVRPHLVFTPQIHDGEIEFYLVEDNLHGRFYRLGTAEYLFVTGLDGKSTIEDAFSELSKSIPNHCLTEVDAIGLCKWLVEMDLTQSVDSTDADRLLRRGRIAKQSKRRANANPLAFRIPFIDPNRFLSRLLGSCRWSFSRWSIIAACLLVAYGACNIISDWYRFAASAENVFATSNWIWLIVCWSALKLIHETAHGLTCKFYGGNIPEAGIQILWLMPLPYVDVTSSWRFHSRWQRIHVAAAGMIAEFLIASLSAIVWSQTEPGFLNHLAYNVIVMASLSTWVFNANPLMKLDGYYIFSDLIRIPNLYGQGQRRVRAGLERLWLGVSTRLPTRTRRQSCIIFTYGWLSLLWRIAVTISLTIAVSRYFGQASVWVIGIVTLGCLGLSTFKWFLFLCFDRSSKAAGRKRSMIVAMSVAAIATGFFTWIPWLGRSEAPAIIEYAPPIRVRTVTAGRVVEVLVNRGQQVEANEVLLVQENRELSTRISSLELQIQQCAIRERKYQQKGQLALQQSEAEQREALHIELTENRIEEKHLEVRAPQAGTIVHRDLARLIGTYLKAGDEVLSLADESSKELRVSISQNDFNTFQRRIGSPVFIDVPGQPMFKGNLEKIIPRASLKPSYVALTTVNGGTLPVRQNHDRTEPNEEFELLSPHLEGVVRIDTHHCTRLYAGQRAIVSYRACQESVGQHLFDLIDRAIRYDPDKGRSD